MATAVRVAAAWRRPPLPLLLLTRGLARTAPLGSTWTPPPTGDRTRNRQWVLAAGGCLTGLGLLAAFRAKRDEVLAEVQQPQREGTLAGHRITGLPEFNTEEVSKHDSMEKRVWVIYREGVYDITDFIPKHPGAKNVLMAAGGSVEPFWEIYAVHKGNEEVLAMLEEYRVGNFDQDEFRLQQEQEAARAAAGNKEGDYFANEPLRHPSLAVVSQKPFNAETPLDLIADNFFTPNELFFVRNHMPSPEISAEEYELEVNVGGDDAGLVLSLADLKRNFPKHEVVATIQCGGNRRAEMKATGRPLKGLSWTGGAIGNARWGGARLVDVFRAAGLDDSRVEAGRFKHVIFEGYDTMADGSHFGASIPISKGLDPKGDVLLAYEMNGAPLPRDHGFPVRVIVPGTIGVRNVKWVKSVGLSEEESHSHMQRGDYKGFNPSVDWDTVDFSKSPAIQSMPVTSSITEPKGKVRVDKEDGTVNLRGYAWSGGGHRIIRVDLTTDCGKTWIEANLDQQDVAEEPRHYGWTLWSAKVQVDPGASSLEVWSKAVDSGYNVQPESFHHIWNLRGVLSNAYCKVKLDLDRR